MAIVNESNSTYHNNKAISRSGLWTLLTKTPFHLLHSQGKRSRAMDIGSAVHAAVLEPDSFVRVYVKGPEDRRGNKWREALDEAEAHGRTLLVEGDYNEVEAIAETALSNSIVQSLLSGNKLIEQSIYHTENGVDVKVRPDLINIDKRIMVDLKTTSDASERGFSSSVAKFGYHLQQFMYMDVYNKQGGDVDAFLFICLEKPQDGMPPIIKTYQLDEMSNIEGERIYNLALERYKECVDNKTFPAYGDDIGVISLPQWAYNIGGVNE